jgi:hypothetical protein
MPADRGAASAEDTPGTISNAQPAAVSAAISLAVAVQVEFESKL